jgi:diguanylate cyclase (GGDEF)-like protein
MPREELEQATARIVVADDDPDILTLVVRVLAREGHEVLPASNGTEALELARRQEPDLLLLDVSMPEMDGYAVCRALQESGAASPSVIFLTAHAHTSARVMGLDAGAVDYVTKPFEPNELRARVRAALRTKTERDALAVEASTDALTGLLNRSQLGTRLSELVSFARRQGRPLGCLMIDLDHFKAVNDTYGHGVGDAVLAEAARRFGHATRPSDIVFRYGGEEFLVLLPETDLQGSLGVAERLRDALGSTPVTFAGDGAPPVDISVRASVGAASLTDGMADGSVLVAAADAALYRAKAQGRDRIEGAGEARAA